MNDLTDLRSAWQQTTAGLDNSIVFNSEEQLRSLINRQTTVERLAARYRHFIIVSLVALPLGFVFMMPEFSEFENGWILTLIYMVILLTSASFDCWFYSQIKAIDCVRQPVSKVTATAMRCRRAHLRFVAIAMPLVALAMLGAGWVVFHDLYYIIAMSFGMVIGGVIGLSFLMKFMRDYRMLRGE